MAYLLFTGDINLTDNAFDIGFGIGSLLKKGELKPFDNLKKQEDDIWIGNFEGVVADISNKKGYSRDIFRISTETFDKCESIIDYWGVANNHSMEHGAEAFRQMEIFLKTKGKGIFGSDTKRTAVFDCCGKKISVTGFSLRVEEKNFPPLYWHLPEWKDIQEESQKKNYADYKIAYIHWGVEYVDHPSFEQVKLAHWLVDIGYDLVIGMHPHVLQGFEIYKGKYIFYSLGNTVFNMNHKPSKYGALVRLDVTTGEVSYQYILVNDKYCPEILDESKVPEPYRFTELNAKISSEKNIEKYINEFHKGLESFRKSNYKDFVSNISHFRIDILMQIIKEFIKRKIS